MIRFALAGLALLALAGQVAAKDLRIATFNVELARAGPGLLLRDIQDGGDAQIAAVVDVIARMQPDILALQGIDYDYDLAALRALNDRLAAVVSGYPHLFAHPTNRGLSSGLDLDGDGRTGTPTDAQGFGRFYGQGAMALLSRFPIDVENVQDFTALLWTDLPGADLPRNADGTPFPDAATRVAQRLSSSGHWIVPVEIAPGLRLDVLSFHASPPVFDGPEDRNGRRNADEIRLWTHVLDGRLGKAPVGPFVLAGAATLDPHDSDGRHDAIRELLKHPRLQDPMPTSSGAANAPAQGHAGSGALDTVDWPRVGRLRVDYVLPSSDIEVLDAGVHWPAPGEPGHDTALQASRHRLVWVDLRLRR